MSTPATAVDRNSDERARAGAASRPSSAGAPPRRRRSRGTRPGRARGCPRARPRTRARPRRARDRRTRPGRASVRESGSTAGATSAAEEREQPERRRPAPGRPSVASGRGQLERASGRARPTPRSCRARDRLRRGATDTRSRRGRTPSGISSPYCGPSPKPPIRRLSIAASARPTPESRRERRPRRPEADDQRRDEPLQPEQRSRVDRERGGGRGRDRGEGREPADEPERERDQGLDRKPDEPAASGSEAIACSARPCRVRSSVHAASAASAAASPITKNDRTWTLRAGDRDDPVPADVLEVERVGEDVRRAREDGADHAAERERDRERRGDPPDRRAARAGTAR